METAVDSMVVVLRERGAGTKRRSGRRRILRAMDVGRCCRRGRSGSELRRGRTRHVLHVPRRLPADRIGWTSPVRTVETKIQGTQADDDDHDSLAMRWRTPRELLDTRCSLPVLVRDATDRMRARAMATSVPLRITSAIKKLSATCA
jgi:hypothetical protein